MIAKEIELWPAIWERDFGFAPIGVHKVEPNMVWFYDDACIETSADLLEHGTGIEKLAEAQIAAALSRVNKLDFTVQFRGKNIWLHRPLVEDSKKSINKLFDSEELLVRNLARMSDWLLTNDFVDTRIVVTHGATNLHMLLGKFDIS